ncbi:MAG TPA: hypothetical protein VF400_03615, partial [Anaeromyxobacteraceae bacterium]
AEFDTRRAWAEEGYGSLWDYLLRVLHLREGAAFRRIAAMRVLRRLPALAEALRDGRLCLSTVTALGPLLTEANVGELVARAAFLTKAGVERLVVALQPRTAPKDGLRRLPSKKAQPCETATPVDEPSAPTMSVATAPPPPAAFQLAPPSSRATLEPVTADTYSLRVTVDAALEKEIEELKALLSLKIPNGDLTAVVREAVQCALEKHRKRKGAAEPARKRKSPVTAKAARPSMAASPFRQRCGARSGSATRVGAPGAARTGSAAAAPGRSSWTTSGRLLLADPARSRISGSSAARITPCPRSTSSGGRTWICSGPRRRPERVKMLLLEEVKVAALRCERVRSFAASASPGQLRM